MNAFLIGLQFLTRISIVRQTVWTEEDFGRSVKFFPAIGAVLGISYVAIIGLIINLTDGRFQTLEAAIVLALTVMLTGGIHCDGFMDTFDGLFSGRDRERMLEIMKDSHVGAFGAVSFMTLAIVEFATLEELTRLPSETFLSAIYAMPILGRLMMAMTIGLFPYARREGMGKAFAQYTTGSTLIFAAVETLILLLPIAIVSVEMFLAALASACAAFMFTLYFGHYATKKLGGVTGDVYGAVTLISESIVLITFLMF